MSDRPGEDPADGGGDAVPTVRLEHPFFHRLDDLTFRLDEATEEPVAVVVLGEERLALPFRGIRREFALDEDTADGRMLGTLEKALRYVKGLRLGDPLPSEILTRKASWKPEARHRQIAYHRLAMQVLSWLSGDEHVVTNPDELLQVAGDPGFRRKVNDAFGEAAEHLGYGRAQKERVVSDIHDLSDELAYVEALRDRHAAVERVMAKVQLLRKAYGTERTVLDTITPVVQLLSRALREFGDMFEQIDAQTGEIMAALRNIDAQKTFIQDMRDELHVRLMAWDELLDDWERVARPKKGENSEDLLARTYHFLAPRYMPVDEWAMMTKLQDAPVELPADGRRATAKRVRRLGGQMEWT